MSKVKSAIITSLVVIAIIVAAFFGTISFNVSATQRYNSIAASISLGSDFTGYATRTLYPEGVVSADEYAYLTADEQSGYEKQGAVYVNLSETGYDSLAELSSAVSKDAQVLAGRFADRKLSDFSVSVQDGVTIKVSVPTNYSYAAYAGDDTNSRSEYLSVATSTISFLTSDGEMTLRTPDASITVADEDGNESTINMTYNEDEYTDVDILGDGSKTYSFVSANENVADYFSSVTGYTFGGNHVLHFNLTEYGRERMRYVTTLAASSDSNAIYLCIGDTLILSITATSTMDSDTMEFALSTSDMVSDAAVTLNSVVNDGVLSVKYSDDGAIYSSSASAGELSALMALIACIVVVVAFAVAAIIKYKRLGGIVAMNGFVFALVMLYALYLLSIQVTFAVIATCFAALIIFGAANLAVFSEVRAQCKTGKTMQSAIKTAYRKTLFGIMDMHIILLVAAIILASVAAGEAAACGLILVIGTIASYALYWFTRLMWHVLSAPRRDKFAFGGFKREVYGDD